MFQVTPVLIDYDRKISAGHRNVEAMPTCQLCDLSAAETRAFKPADKSDYATFRGLRQTSPAKESQVLHAEHSATCFSRLVFHLVADGSMCLPTGLD